MAYRAIQSIALGYGRSDGNTQQLVRRYLKCGCQPAQRVHGRPAEPLLEMNDRFGCHSGTARQVLLAPAAQPARRSQPLVESVNCDRSHIIRVDVHVMLDSHL